jgi:hypothetical protein
MRYAAGMHRVPGGTRIALAGALALLGAVPGVVLSGRAITQETAAADHATAADATATNAVPGGIASNPFLVITNRNAFGIKPPAPPPDPKLNAPPAPPPNLFVTGFSQLRGNKRAFLVMNRPGKSPEFLVVDESYDVDGLKVTGIDPRKETLTVINAGTEVTLNFKDNGLKPGIMPVGQPMNGLVPGAVPGNGMVRPVPQVFTPGAPGAPTVVRRSAADFPAISESPETDSGPRQGRRGVYTGGGGGGTAGGFNGGGPVYPPGYPGAIAGGVPATTLTDPVSNLPPPSASSVPAAPGVVANPGSGRTPPPVPYIPR